MERNNKDLRPPTASAPYTPNTQKLHPLPFCMLNTFFMISGINCGRPTNLSRRVGFSSSLPTRICIVTGTCMQSTPPTPPARDLPVSCNFQILPSIVKLVNVIKCFLIYSCPIKVGAFGYDLWMDCKGFTIYLMRTFRRLPYICCVFMGYVARYRGVGLLITYLSLK